MISLQEIKPRQIRALLLLLVLAPLIPTGLLLRFMFDTVVQEREAAREIITSAWQDSLTIALRVASDNLRAETDGAASPRQMAEKINRSLQRSFEHEVQVRIFAASGEMLAGPGQVDGGPVATSAVETLLPGGRVELFLSSPAFVREAVQEQIDTYAITAALVISANIAIASLAGWAFLRQIRTQEMKTSSLATLAHELRTPVASMRLLLETMQSGRCAEAGEYLQLIAQENQRLAHLVDQFLTHSRLELGTHDLIFHPVAPASLADAAESHLQHRLQAAGCRYQRDLATGLPEVLGDRDSLVCALTILLENALKYTGAEKVITLRIEPRGQGVEFSVQDRASAFLRTNRKPSSIVSIRSISGWREWEKAAAWDSALCNASFICIMGGLQCKVHPLKAAASPSGCPGPDYGDDSHHRRRCGHVARLEG